MLDEHFTEHFNDTVQDVDIITEKPPPPAQATFVPLILPKHLTHQTL